MSFITSILATGNQLLYLVQGEDKSGRQAFYYVLVDRLKKEMFLKEVTGQETDLRKYGAIIYSGFGNEPTEEAKRFIKQEYGLDVI